MSDNKVMIELGYDTTKLESGAKQVLQQTAILNNQLKAQGKTAGSGMAENLANGLRSGQDKIQKVSVLAGMAIGSFMGKSAGDKFKSTMSTAVQAGMGGLFAGMAFGPVGALFGALAGVSYSLYESLSEQSKVLDEVAKKYGVLKNEVYGLIKLDTSSGVDGVNKRLELWKKNIESIIARKPEMIKALKEMKLVQSESDIERLSSQSPLEHNKTMAEGILKSNPELAKQLEQDRIAWANDPANQSSRSMLNTYGMSATSGLSTAAKQYSLSEDKFNSIYRNLPEEEQKRLAKMNKTDIMSYITPDYSNVKGQEDLFNKNKALNEYKTNAEKAEKELNDLQEKKNALMEKDKSISEQVLANMKKRRQLALELSGIDGNTYEDKKKRLEIEMRITELNNKNNELAKQTADLNSKMTELKTKQKEKAEEIDNYVKSQSQWTTKGLADKSLPGETKPYEPLKILGPSTPQGMRNVMLARTAENMKTWALKARLEGRPDLADRFTNQSMGIEKHLENMGIIQKSPLEKLINSSDSVRIQIETLQKQIDKGIRISSGA